MGQSVSSFYSDISHGRLEHLDKEKCFQTYDVEYLSDRGTLVLLSNNLTGGNQSLLYRGIGLGSLDSGMNWTTSAQPFEVPSLYMHVPTPYGTSTINITNFTTPPPCASSHQDNPWCQDLDTLHRLMISYEIDGKELSAKELRAYLDNATNWKNSSWAADVTFDFISVCVGTWSVSLGNYRVEGCLSLKTDEHCELLFSPPTGLVVIAGNMIKVICMLLTAREDREDIFLTVGDAISSFLTRPDPTTRGRCLMSRSSVARGPHSWQTKGRSLRKTLRNSCRYPLQTLFPEILPKRERWLHAASLRRWTRTMNECVRSPRFRCKDAVSIHSLQQLEHLSWCLGLPALSSHFSIVVL